MDNKNILIFVVCIILLVAYPYFNDQILSITTGTFSSYELTIFNLLKNNFNLFYVMSIIFLISFNVYDIYNS